MTRNAHVLAACLLLLAIVPAAAVPLEILGNPDLLPPDGRPTDQSYMANVSGTNSFEVGDTAFFICNEGVFTFGSVGGTDCWGWEAPDGTEYAIMGTYFGLAFVNVTTMEVADTLMGPTGGCAGAYWRDMVTYQHYAYCVSECSGTNEGLMIIDLQYLPDSVHLVQSVPVSNLGHVTSHNVFVDTIKGYLYAEGTSSSNFSIHIHSLADPENPDYKGSFGPAGIHDMYVMNDTAYVAAGWNPYFEIYDMTNKTSPALLATVVIPSAGYVHNIWPTEDRRHVATTEETPNKTIKIWNIEDLGDIQLVGEYLAPSDLAHNARVKGDTVFVSHYESGVAAVDISNPALPAELWRYDTYTSETSNFNGCWGVFPYTSSGRTYASNMDGRLFILSENVVIVTDTLIALPAVGAPGSQVRIDLYARWSLPMRNFNVPVNWGGPYNMSIDSFSTQGLMTEYFEEQAYSAYDPFNKRAAYSITSSLTGTSPDLPPGEGVIMSVFLSIPGGASGGPNPITFTPFSGKVASFSHQCTSITPDTINGEVTLGVVSCCVGDRGNVDSDLSDMIDVSDLVYMADYMFGSENPEPQCFEEADVNADSLLDIADLTYLVEFMFNSGQLPESCP